MVQTHELYWAAGFIEGEGHFSGTGRGKNTHLVGAGQRAPETLEHLQRIFGGGVYYNRSNGMYNWCVTGSYARGVMMTLYPLLSERRKAKIQKCLDGWSTHVPESGRHSRGKPYCVNGHLRTPENLYITPKTGVRACRLCRTVRYKALAARRKAARQSRYN